MAGVVEALQGRKSVAHEAKKDFFREFGDLLNQVADTRARFAFSTLGVSQDRDTLLDWVDISTRLAKLHEHVHTKIIIISVKV